MAEVKKISPETFLSGMHTAFEQVPENLSLSSTLRELQGWDSLAAVMLVAEIYADYRVHISGDELRDCKTVADLFLLVQAKIQATA